VDALLARSRDLGLSVTEGFMYLYHPQFLALRALVNSERIGEIRSIHCRFGIPPLERPGFRLTPELGGGAFLDVGCYVVSAIAALYPEAEPEILFSEIVTRIGDPVDSSGRAVLRYSDEVRVTLEWGSDCGYRNEIDIWGSRGSVQTERFFSKPADFVPIISVRDLRGSQSSQSVSPGNHFVAMLHAFRQAATETDAAERERRRISHRARIMERIRIART
jgi:predicted dehydrogenase